MSQFVGHDVYLDRGYVPAVDPALAHFYEDPLWDFLYTSAPRPAGDDLYVTLGVAGDSVSSLIEPASSFRYADNDPFDPYSISSDLSVWLQMRTSDLDHRFYDVALSGPSGTYLPPLNAATGDALGWLDYVHGINDFVDEANYPAFLADLAAGAVLLTVTLTTGLALDIAFAGLAYHPATAAAPGRPPLRQWPRDDGLRRIPSRFGVAGPTSRQGSLRRGPRGTYT